MLNSDILSEQPIGVFDSGVGGLTVLRALQAQLPGESFLYLGDTARLPYGTKSPETILRYARQAVQVLIARRVKLIVLACNTVSALALTALQSEFSRVVILGVIEPGAIAACQASKTGQIAVIATEATVKTASYQRAIKHRRPDAVVTAQACGLFVALAEEGWLDGPITEAIAARYLHPLLLQGNRHHPDCLVLGCTHFPALIDVIEKIAGPAVLVVDSAKTTAAMVDHLLQSTGLMAAGRIEKRTRKFLVTDDPERFIRIANQFLGMAISASAVDLVNL